MHVTRVQAITSRWVRSATTVTLILAIPLGVLGVLSLQVGFARQLFFAELLFAVGFGLLFVFISACYFVGIVVQLGWKFMEHEIRKTFERPTHFHARLRTRPLEVYTTDRHSSS